MKLLADKSSLAVHDDGLVTSSHPELCVWQEAQLKCASSRSETRCCRSTAIRWQTWATRSGSPAWIRRCKTAAWSWTSAVTARTVSHLHTEHVWSCATESQRNIWWLHSRADSAAHASRASKQFWHFKLVQKLLWSLPWMISWQLNDTSFFCYCFFFAWWRKAGVFLTVFLFFL